MKTENLGEIFFDGRIIGLDNVAIEDINNILSQIKNEEEKCMNKLNNVLMKIQ